jgi:serine/threonine-protein kinase HipA
MSTIFVYIDLEGIPVLVGRLWPRLHQGRESATFEYDPQWLTLPQRFSLEPALHLGAGPQHTAQDQAIFGSLGDSAPDRWGRTLMRYGERRRADREERKPRTPMPSGNMAPVRWTICESYGDVSFSMC